MGCSGWSYGARVGPFYPKGTGLSDYLRLYSRAFDCVEIDSTFYGVPDTSAVKAWKDSTPGNFRFASKVPREITHERRLTGVERPMSAFIDRISLLGDKLGIVLIQLPPSFTFGEGFERLSSMLNDIPPDLKFAVEFRHRSWFRDDVIDLLTRREVSMAWAEVPMTQTPAILTSPTAYVRLVGDRSISENQFGTIRRDRTEAIKKWADAIGDKKEEIRRAFVFSNNHFQGFGPASVNLFREAMGLTSIDWAIAMRSYQTEGQRTLF